MVFNSVDPEVWKPSEKKEFTGYLISSTPDSGKYENSTVYNVEEFGSHKKYVIFGNRVLQDKMIFAKLGDLVKIQYLGIKTSKKGQEYNDYNVLIDDGVEEKEEEVKVTESTTVTD